MFLAETTTPIDWKALLNTLVNWCMTTGLKLVLGLIVLFIVFKLTNMLTKKLYKRLQRKQVDETLARVGTSAIRISIKVLVFTVFVAFIGIETASISALIASVGVGLSLALQGSLSNFAGGLIIIVMRPFRIGDYITTNGESGTVEDIHMFYTTLVTSDNKVVYVPNGELANNVIVNTSVKDTRRVEVIMSVAYQTDIEQAKRIIAAVCEDNETIFKDPIPYITVGSYGDSAMNMLVRVWCQSKDYWPVTRYLTEQIKIAFDRNGIEIPFNQLEVAIKEKTIEEEKQLR